MKILKIILIVLAIIFLTVLIIGFSLNKPLPQGITGNKAEQLAEKILASINKSGFDSLEYIAWDFPRGHAFEWDKKANFVIATWGENRVEFYPDTMAGIAYQGGQKISGKNADQLIQKAWSLFANDSFWLFAPFKIKDPGTILTSVQTEEGEALLVTYTTGGVTPGDSYLWILDENGMPKAWQMWVKIIPIGGLSFSWEGWVQHKDVWLSTVHKGPLSTKINLNIKAIR